MGTGGSPVQPGLGMTGVEAGGVTTAPGGPRTFTPEAPLKEALMIVWEQARQAKGNTLKTLSLRAFDHTDIFRLLSALDGVSGAEKTVQWSGAYESKAKASLSLEFRGPVEDAKPVKDFLEQEFRMAGETQLDATFLLTFEDGLSLQGDAPEKLAERLTRFSTGAALVEANAQEA